MKITVDIHTRLLGVIAAIGLIVLGIYQYHTKVKCDWQHAEKLELSTVGIFIFFMIMPFSVAMFCNRKDLEVGQSEIAKMGKFRQFLNSPKSVEFIYFGMMYLLTTMLIFVLISEAIK